MARMIFVSLPAAGQDARGEARPAFQRALADQLAVFSEHQPEREGEAA